MYVGSYLWRLRQTVGHDLVLMPGATVLAVDSAGRILLTKRSDTGEWCLPGGAAEAGGSFLQTAVTELEEETGLQVAPEDLVPIGCLSEASMNTFAYPNGDVTHYFAVCFLARRWSGQVAAHDQESTEVAFFSPDHLPRPMQELALPVLELYERFKRTGVFQVS
jgi:8-oxo-dGTP pyrophosphatase MutT (NUDIX family)